MRRGREACRLTRVASDTAHRVPRLEKRLLEQAMRSESAKGVKRALIAVGRAASMA
jgi:hypothetical protein